MSRRLIRIGSTLLIVGGLMTIIGGAFTPTPWLALPGFLGVAIGTLELRKLTRIRS